MEIIEMGSLLLNGRPVLADTKYSGEQISFGNTVPGKSIRFINLNNIYIADRCLCVNISWSDLNRQGFAFGHIVRINGLPYLCRLPKMNVGKKTASEWDAFLSAYGEEDDFCHWEKRYFWGQEPHSTQKQNRYVRGYFAARGWHNHPAWFRRDYIGFRPVLEPLPAEPPVTDDLIGHSIKIHGGGNTITGCLTGYDDFDLMLKVKAPLDMQCLWAKQVKDVVYIDREAVAYIEKGG